jgi:hypothetical protein
MMLFTQVPIGSILLIKSSLTHLQVVVGLMVLPLLWITQITTSEEEL